MKDREAICMEQVAEGIEEGNWRKVEWALDTYFTFSALLASRQRTRESA